MVAILEGTYGTRRTLSDSMEQSEARLNTMWQHVMHGDTMDKGDSIARHIQEMVRQHGYG